MIPTAPTTPDWMKDLLPDGGKVSVTVHSGAQAASPGGSTAPAVDPSTGVTLPPGRPASGVPTAVAAMRNMAPQVASGTATDTTATPGPAGGATPPSGGIDPTKVTPPTDPHASDAYNKWWNPYTGRFDIIPGVDTAGKVTDANAFWNYYTKYPSAGLDKIANTIAHNNDPGAWQHQYTPAEIQAMVTGNSDYLTGLGGINQNRFNLLMQLGDFTPEQAAAFGLTPEQIKAIRENPNSDLNTIRDALRTGVYNNSSSYASRGAYNSGARMNDVGNLQTGAAKDELAKRFQLATNLDSENQHVQELFRDIKDKMESEGGFDPGDTETNKEAWETTHKTIAAATKTFADFLAHVKTWQKLKTVADMRGALNDARKMYAQYGKYVSPAEAGKLKAIIDGLTIKIHNTVMARSAAQARPPVKGGSQAGGAGGYTRPGK